MDARLKGRRRDQGGAGATDIYISSRLRLARKLAALSQEQLAERVGVTFQQIQKYETAANRISANRLWQIALVLNLPVSFFLPPTTGGRPHAGAGRPSEPARTLDLMKTRESVDLQAAYLRIDDPEIRRRVLALVRSIAEDPARALPDT